MQTGWLTLNDTKYYLNSAGDMAVGWRWIGDAYYYFHASGAMATSEWVDGYYLDSNGKWVDSTSGGMESLLGTWQGTLTDAWKDAHHCFGSELHVPILNITDVSAQYNRIKFSITFLVHNHDELNNDSSETKGDEMFSLVDKYASLNPASYDWQELYNGKTANDARFSISIKFISNGEKQLRISSHKYYSPSTWGYWSDFFTLNRK